MRPTQTRGQQRHRLPSPVRVRLRRDCEVLQQAHELQVLLRQMARHLGVLGRGQQPQGLGRRDDPRGRVPVARQVDGRNRAQLALCGGGGRWEMMEV